MKTVKMSLANIQGKLSRNEMKQIMAGSSGYNCAPKGAECPAPGATYDGCCSSCNNIYSPSGKTYCN